MKCKWMSSLVLPFAALVLMGFAAPSNAALVSGWGLETGFTNGDLTEGSPGEFSISQVSGNAPPRALVSGIDFTQVGVPVRLTGFATFANTLGNVQFRFGMYDTNGVNTGTLDSGEWVGATSSGWKGYYGTPGNAGGADNVTGMGTGIWFSGNDNYSVGSQGSATSAAGNVEYEFSLTLTRLGASEVQIDYTFVGGAEDRSGSFVDNGGNSTSLATIDAVGFLTNNNTGSSSFRDVQVFVVPEPSALLMVLSGVALVGLRRRIK